MENTKIIIILLGVIIAILIVGVLVFSEMAKEDTNLAIAGNKINVGDSLVVKLTDSKGGAIAGQTISIKIMDKD